MNDQGICILLADDHADGMVPLKRLLTHRGHQVISAETIADARRLAKEHRCQLLITDLELPDGSGIDLFHYLHAFYGIPGIALNGHGNEEYRRACKQAGFSAFLVKPTDIDAVKATIRSVMSRLPQTAAVGVRTQAD